MYTTTAVKRGDLLFELDDTPFRNKVEAAQIALEQARLSNEQLDAQIAAAQASLKTAVLTARNDKVTYDRYQKLSTLQNVSQADLDKVRTTGRAASSPSVRCRRTSVTCAFSAVSGKNTATSPCRNTATRWMKRN